MHAHTSKGLTNLGFCISLPVSLPDNIDFGVILFIVYLT